MALRKSLRGQAEKHCSRPVLERKLFSTKAWFLSWCTANIKQVVWKSKSQKSWWKTVIYKSHLSRNFSLPVNSAFGTKAWNAFSIFINCYSYIPRSWKAANSGGIKSPIKCLEICRNRITDILVCPCFTVLLHSCERFTIFKIVWQKAHLQYNSRRARLPIRFKAKHPCQLQKRLLNVSAGWCSTADKLCAHFGSIERRLKPLLEFEKTGLTVVTKYEKNALLLLLLAS